MSKKSSEPLSGAASQLGHKGGDVRALNLSARRRKEIARQGGKAKASKRTSR